MQACETQGTALAADLNAVKADAGLTADPLFKANMANIASSNTTSHYWTIQHSFTTMTNLSALRIQNAEFWD